MKLKDELVKSVNGIDIEAAEELLFIWERINTILSTYHGRNPNLNDDFLISIAQNIVLSRTEMRNNNKDEFEILLKCVFKTLEPLISKEESASIWDFLYHTYNYKLEKENPYKSEQDRLKEIDPERKWTAV
jgi:hypothetical protein